MADDWCGLCNQDVDKLFSYNTRKEVNIQDYRIGCTNMCLQFGMISYIVLGIFYYGLGYLDHEQARGAIATHVRGDAVGVSTGKAATRYFSAEELTYPGLENGNVFVATRQRVTKQKRGVCVDNTMPCSTNDDCTVAVNGTCTEQGFCEEMAWCPLDGEDGEDEVYELEVGELAIWVKSSIQFIMLDPETVYSTERHFPYPVAGENLFTVRELLLMCEPVPVRYEEISELGAAIEVQFIWNCDIDLDTSRCKPRVMARRLDVMFDPENIGYAFNYAEEVSDEERVLNQVRGVRIFLRTYGTGFKVSLTMVVMKLSTTFTLLGMAPLIADVLARYAFGRRSADKYIARVREDSPDFSDYMRKVKEQEDAEKAFDNAQGGLNQQDLDAALRKEDEEFHRKLNEEG